MDHGKALELLPWLVNGTLPGAERAAVEAHLAACEDCRRERLWEEELRARVQGDDTVELAPQAPLRRLLARIDEVPQPVERRRAVATVAPARRPRRRRWLMTVIRAQSIAIVALIALLLGTWYEGAIRPDFVTLTSNGPVSPDAMHPAALVVPAHATEPGDIAALFERLNLRQVGGPNAAGAYLVVPLDDEAASAEEWLQRLRAEPELAWVGRRSAP